MKITMRVVKRRNEIQKYIVECMYNTFERVVRLIIYIKLS